MACDDHCFLRMGLEAPNEKPEELTPVIENKFALPYRYYLYPQFRDEGVTEGHVISEWISLTKGNKYYMEFEHYENRGDDFATVSVEIEKANVPVTHPNARKELQKITMKPQSLLRERTFVKVINPTGGSIYVRIQPANGDVWQSNYFADDLSAHDFRR